MYSEWEKIGKLTGKGRQEGLHVDGRLLEQTIRKQVSIRGIGLIRLRIRVIREPL